MKMKRYRDEIFITFCDWWNWDEVVVVVSKSDCVMKEEVCVNIIALFLVINGTNIF